MHESCDVGDGDDDVDHDEDGGDEVCQEEERRQEHAQLQEDYTANWICSVIQPVSRKVMITKTIFEKFSWLVGAPVASYHPSRHQGT